MQSYKNSNVKENTFLRQMQQEVACFDILRLSSQILSNLEFSKNILFLQRCLIDGFSETCISAIS